MSMSETVKILDALETLRDHCHENSKAHGFWDGENGDSAWNFGEKIALLHTELSEMFEAWRKNVGHLPCDKDITIIAPECRTPDDPIGTRRITAVEEEVADVFIRLMDLCGKLDIDVGRVVLAKMVYNRDRPYKHGGIKS